MAEEFNKELCEERHDKIEQTFSRLFREIKDQSIKLNWFYIIAIMTLAGIVATFIKVG